MTEKSWVTRSHAGILKDFVERAGGLYCGTLVWAWWGNPSTKVDWPEVQIGFIKDDSEEEKFPKEF